MEARKAVDGNYNPHPTAGACFQTGQATTGGASWYALQLASALEVTRVVITIPVGGGKLILW